jgi:hypothetical protein
LGKNRGATLVYPRDEWAESVLLSAAVTGWWWEPALAEEWTDELFPDPIDRSILRAVRVVRFHGGRRRVRFDMMALNVFIRRHFGENPGKIRERFLELIDPVFAWDVDYHWPVWSSRAIHRWRDRAAVDHAVAVVRLARAGQHKEIRELVRCFSAEDERARQAGDAAGISGRLPGMPILSGIRAGSPVATDQEGAGLCGAHMGSTRGGE